MLCVCLSRGLRAISSILGQDGAGKTIAFIPNAGDPYEDPYFVEESRKRIEVQGFNVINVDLKEVTGPADLTNRMRGCDAVFVAGGNTFWLLQMLRSKGLVTPLKQMVEAGLPYFGESAGAVILYSDIEPAAMIDDPAVAPDLDSTAGLSLVGFFTLPHVDREKYADLFDKFVQKNKADHSIVKIRDDQAIVTRDGSTYEIIDSPIDEIE